MENSYRVSHENVNQDPNDRGTRFAERAIRPYNDEEVLMKIFLEIFGYLSHRDLKLSISLVCKCFNILVGDVEENTDLTPSANQVDKILWRDAPQPFPAVQVRRVELNPTLWKLHYSYTADINDVVIRPARHRRRCHGRVPYRYLGAKKLVEMPCLAGENVCCPAASTAVFHFNHPHVSDIAIQGTGRGGAVTVLDVMKSIARAIEVQDWPQIHLLYGGVDVTWGVADGHMEGGVLHLYDQDPLTRGMVPVSERSTRRARWGNILNTSR